MKIQNSKMEATDQTETQIIHKLNNMFSLKHEYSISQNCKVSAITSTMHNCTFYFAVIQPKEEAPTILK